MSDDDLIRRGDALHAVDMLYLNHTVAAKVEDAIAALPAAPTFTAADLERAWEMGRDTLGSRLDHQPRYVRALAPPPADLAQRVKGPAHD